MRKKNDRKKQVESYAFDFVVVGGSPGGLSAALIASRFGLKTAIIHNRPVLGGNASSEIGVSSNITGAFGMGYNRHMRETGIVEEIKLKAFFEVYPHIESMIENVYYDLAMRESENLTLFLNTDAYRVDTGGRRITGIQARQIGSEREFYFTAPFFADCSGDGFVAFEAGNEFRYGREAQSEFNESMAPAVADDITLGASLMFRVEDAGQPVEFIPPPWARKFMEEDAFPHRFHKFPGFQTWWCEHGGRLDPIHDHERIKAELLEVITGLWDHVKNHGSHGADNKRIVKIKPLVGRRESRRIEGRYILNENDLRPDNGFKDAVCYGGWPIDLHPADGVLSQAPPAEQKFIEPYNIPLRSLIAKDIDNLTLAGRHVSITHCALGSTRVISTICGMGMAIGMATVMAKQGNYDYAWLIDHPEELQQRLLRYDATILNVPNQDPDDLARHAMVKASSGMSLKTGAPDSYKLFLNPISHVVRIACGRLDAITLYIKPKSASAATLRLAVYQAADNADYGNEKILSEETSTIAFDHGKEKMVTFKLNADIPSLYARFTLETDAEVYIGYSLSEPPGVTRGIFEDGAFVYDRGHHDEDEAMWVYERGCYSFNLTPASYPFAPEMVVNGVSRYYREPNLWISDPEAGLPAWIELDLGREQTVACVHLTFDSDLDSPHIYHADTLVKDYRVQAPGPDGEYADIIRVRGNRQRKCIHNFAPIRTSKVRILVTATNGGDSARIYELRAYAQADLYDM
ncbi:MAG: FAD-dependent oxidoreductase [Lentisphaerota bacterium]